MKNKTLLLIIGLFIALIIAPILLTPGYMFALDHVLNPHWWMPKVWSNVYIVWVLSQIFTFLHIPIWLLEKTIILIAFSAPALGWYLLLKERVSHSSALLFWILFLVFNPFLYNRFIDWQINIYLSFALFPLFVYLLQNTLNNFSYKKAVWIWIYSLLLCLVSIHNLIFLALIGIIFGCFYFKKTGVKHIMSIWIIALLCNTLWLVPFFLWSWEKFELTKQITEFWEAHREAFKTQWVNSEIYFNSLSMHGYWWEAQKRFTWIKNINPHWKVLFTVIFVLICVGVLSRVDVRNKKLSFSQFEKSLLTLWICSYILSLGVSENNIFAPINQWLYDYVPMYQGMREPQKWILFVVILYAYFGALWVDFLSKKIHKLPLDNYLKKILVVSLVWLPVMYNVQMIGGFSGQISIKQYPQEWEDIKEIIFDQNNNYSDSCTYQETDLSNKCYNTLSLPWHSYMTVGFTQKVVGWWIVRYFWDNILIADNLEYAWIYTQSTRPESKIIERYVQPWGVFKVNDMSDVRIEEFENFITDLQWLWIQNIIFVKESDYQWYQDFLKMLVKNNLLEIKDENNMITLYSVKQ